MRNRQFIRQWKLLCRLSEARLGATYADLIDALGPDDSAALRTIQRDLDALQAAGFGLYSKPEGKQVRWFLRSRVSVPLPLEASELVALHAAFLHSELQQLPGSEALRSFWIKLLAGVGEPMRCFLKNVESAVVVLGPRNAPMALQPRGIDQQVARAIADRKTVEMLYQPLGRQKRRRRVDPHALLSAPPNLYLWGWCHERKEMRTFSLQRIWDLRITETSFRPRDLSAVEAFEGAFEIWQGKPQKVRIRFTGKAAGLVQEKRWHRSQKLEQREGSVELSLAVFPGADLLKWILSFGAEAEVLEPLSLRRTAEEQVAAAARLYGEPAAVRKPAIRVESTSKTAQPPSTRRAERW